MIDCKWMADLKACGFVGLDSGGKRGLQRNEQWM